MKLRTLLQTADLGLTLLVGAGAVDRAIDRVFTATLRDPRRFLRGGELVLVPIGRGDELVDVEQDLPRARDDLFALLGDEDATLVPLEDRDPEHLLDLSDLRRERRLGDMAALRRAMEAELVRNGHDVLELPDRQVVRGDRHD